MRPAFLVDGHTEQRFIQLVCPGRPVQRLGLNGNSVSAIAIAKRAATQIRLWKGRHYPVVIIVDHEERPICFSVFSLAILDAIRAEGIEGDIRVCVARRMIENWILGDAARLHWQDAPDSVDELHGANILKSLLDGYDKAGDGPGLLANARASSIATRSLSFEAARAALADLNCQWLAN